MIWTRKKQNKKWQQRPQLYKGRFFYVKQIAQIVLGVFGFISIIALVLFFKNSEAMRITKIDVSGDHQHLNKDQVIKLSGITNEDKLFKINLREVEERLLRFSWIEKVQLRREFPGIIQIHITERKPWALLLADQLYLVDSDGKVFKKLEKEDPQNLPVMTGFDQSFLRKYPQLSRGYLEKTFAFLKFIELRPYYQEHPISEVHFDNVYGFTVYTQDQGLEIFYGQERLEAKQQKLEKFKLSKQSNAGDFYRLDLDLKNRVIARQVATSTPAEAN